MNRISRMLMCGLATLVISSAAHADVDWSYTTKNSNPIISATNQNVTAGAINFTQQSASATGSSNIQLATVSLTPLVSTTPATFNNPTFSFSFSITSNGGSETTNITGSFINNLNAALKPQYTNKGSSVTLSLNNTDFVMQAGGNNFEVKLPTQIYVPAPFPTGSVTTAAQYATITASVIAETGTGGVSGGGGGGGGGGGTNQTPEPSTMLLGLFGLSACGAAAWKKRKNTTSNTDI